MTYNNSAFTVSNIFGVIKKSLNGEQQDYTIGSIPKAIVLLAIPMILEISLESVFALAHLLRLIAALNVHQVAWFDWLVSDGLN